MDICSSGHLLLKTISSLASPPTVRVSGLFACFLTFEYVYMYAVLQRVFASCSFAVIK